jgi:3-methyl-2-oxobutanoate hydroxymethyltransferase
MGHIGLLPQSVHAMGGYKVQGRTADQVVRLVRDALSLEQAGAFSIVLEGMPPSAAKAVTEAVAIPTIGIGAGPHCDGQVLVLYDLLGLSGPDTPRFARRYAEVGRVVSRAVESFRRDVESGRFPARRHCYRESTAPAVRGNGKDA